MNPLLTRGFPSQKVSNVENISMSWFPHGQIMMTSSNGNIFRITGLCAGIHQSLVNSPHKGQWHRALMFSLICAWINGRVNKRDAGDLRCHCTHYDITIMFCCNQWWNYDISASVCQHHHTECQFCEKISFLHIMYSNKQLSQQSIGQWSQIDQFIWMKL